MSVVKIINTGQDSGVPRRSPSKPSDKQEQELNDVQLNDKVVEAMMKYYAIQESEELWRYVRRQTIP
jgi:hypothetical protein